MNLGLSKLNYSFSSKPLLIGGKAMEYYGIRKAGADIDLVVSQKDHENLKRIYPNNIKNIFGDIGVCEFGFEIWNQICCFKYESLKENAIEQDLYLVLSLEKIVLLKTIAMGIEKYRQDLELLGKYILDIQYGKRRLPT